MEVYALVGAAGTGKSHRASLVAAAYGISHIIDDGLLIVGARIVAGQSAKKEDSKMAAVRRAIFAEQAHAEDVRQALHADRPGKVLILGTSRHMIELITDALDLPRPDKYIDIREIASSEEIRRARRIRRLEGKHVIPAPTFEVKKSFSGYLVDPLRLFRRGGRQEDQVIEKSMVRPTFSAMGKFFISDTVIGAIAERAGCDVDGVDSALRAVVDLDPAGVHVAVEVVVRFGVSLPDVLAAAQVSIGAAIEQMTALNVVSVDVVCRRVVIGDARGPEADGVPAASPVQASPPS
ncbi:MAG TPA: Asp23/Gls24 family envelope stress response protein [Bacillota bacterium]|nr:Asp23/Gls24 family envelope stress response protein [Bacillota bacterium]